MSDIFQIVYLSESTIKIGERELLSLLARARENNAKLGITGLLYFNAGHFLQMLEGPEDLVLAVYQKISKDQRHNNLKLIFEGIGNNRFFHQWTMGYRNHEEYYVDLRDKIENLVGRISRGERLYNAKDALQLFSSISTYSAR